MKYKIIKAIVLILLIPSSLSATDPNFIRHVDNVKNLCYRVETKSGEFLGSGFLINQQGYFLTCDHVILDEDTNIRPDTVRLTGYIDMDINLRGNIIKTSKLISFYAMVKHFEPKFDIAILQIDTIGALVRHDSASVTVNQFRNLAFWKSEHLTEGMDVGLCAFIKDDYKAPKPFISKGIISTIRNRIDSQLNNTVEIIQCDINVSAGTSGGAFFSADNGLIIGFQRAAYFGKDNTAPTSYSTALTVEQITPILDSLNIEYELR